MFMPMHETNLYYLDISDPPAIVTAPSPQTLNETNPLKLYCNATGNPSPNISWVKDGGSGRVYEGEVLYVKQVIKSDQGIYTCTASNGVGKNATSTAMVTVIGKQIHQVLSSPYQSL